MSVWYDRLYIDVYMCLVLGFNFCPTYGASGRYILLQHESLQISPNVLMFMDLVCYIYFLLLCLPYLRLHTWYSSVGVVTGWTAQVRFPAVQFFRLLNIVQTDTSFVELSPSWEAPKKCPALYVIGKFITMFTRAYNWSLVWDEPSP
jgi:hypothetical protein